MPAWLRSSLVVASAGALVLAPGGRQGPAPPRRLRAPGPQLAASPFDFGEVERSLVTERDACGTGFVSEAVLPASRRVVEAALEACDCVEHRGACSADGISGDGAGVLTAVPWAVYEADTAALMGLDKSVMGCGMLFLPRDPAEAKEARMVINRVAKEAGFEVVAWRSPPVDPSVLGAAAESGRPDIEQIFVRSVDGWMGESLEKALYFFRRSIIGAWGHGPDTSKDLYVASMSSRTVVYKAMCRSDALRCFYRDLENPAYVSKFAIYHRRFSTNTMPRWCLAQPFRLIAHNGEINTIRGNINWMAARAVASGGDLGMTAACDGDEAICLLVDPDSLGPVVDADKSDSANLDATCELYTRAGRSVAETLTLLIPPADTESGSLRDFFKVHAPLQEPWDGPAGVCFSDGTVVGARLDRNGLRPARYTRYADGLICVSSETGSGARFVPPPGEIVDRGRLGPGQMCLVDLREGGFFTDAEVRERIADGHDWKAVLTSLAATEKDVTPPENSPASESAAAVRLTELAREQTAFGWGAEDVDMQVAAMVTTGKEATFCMGADAPLAVLSTYAHPLYDYFQQRHAQVTNPPIDPLRESHVMTLEMWLGKRPNCVDAKQMTRIVNLGASIQEEDLVRLDSPVINAAELAYIEETLDGERLSTTYRPAETSLGDAVHDIVKQAIEAVLGGAKVVTLTDAAFDPVATRGEETYVSPLLATGAVHYGLIEAGLRLDASIVVETAQCWSTHHVATLVGYGASAVRPYLLYETANAVAAKLDKKQQKSAQNSNNDDVVVVSGKDAVANVREALDAGVLKIMSKMGIAALSSYHGAQIFEAVGLAEDVVDVAFKGTPSRLGGMSLTDLERETFSFVKAAISEEPEIKVFKLENYGFYNALANKGETHANSPKVAKLLHSAVRDGNDDSMEARRQRYAAFTDELRDQSPCTLRDLLEFKEQDSSGKKKEDMIPSLDEITRSFVTGGMSLGALSREAHETLAIAMNRIGGASNSGEGGEDVARYSSITAATRPTTWKHLRGASIADGDTASSAIKQVASGRFGVTTAYLATASQIEIKIAQGAKPGEGGQLPAAKVDTYIASIRAATEGVQLISPPPHHDIYSIEDLAQLIFDLKAVNPMARVSVKLVAIAGIGTVACGCAKAGADVIQISGHDGGTGAAALTSIKHAGAPLELGISEVHRALVENGLRDRVTLRVDGGIRTGRDVVALALLGAEEFGFGTVAMVAAGCVMARVCHTNNCPVGVATQKENLRNRARGEPADVVRYFELVADDVQQRLAHLGLKSIRDAVGRSDLLRVNTENPLAAKMGAAFKTADLDLDFLIRPPTKGSPAWTAPAKPPRQALLSADGSHFDDASFPVENYYGHRQDDDADHAVAADDVVVHPVTNVDRAIGTRLSGHLARRRSLAAAEGVTSDDEGVGARTLRFAGSAGQSFGAFAVAGLTMVLEGDANDYVGKGLNGARLHIRPPAAAEANGVFDASQAVIVGNTCLYGATKGELFAAGAAGERFGVRNSGADAVVEGTGDHCCEYMTNGAVVVLGPTGINVGAGMTGGEAFIYDPVGDAPDRVNTQIVAVKRVEDDSKLKALVEAHLAATASKKAARLLANWADEVPRFWHIVPPPPKVAQNDREPPPTAAAAAAAAAPTVEAAIAVPQDAKA